ncbi:MAG: AI-2E family transporter [Cyanobacteria bacterium P01_A01_bin.114]
MKYSQWLTLIILVICLYVSWQIRTILLLAFAAVVFAVVLNRAVSFVQRWVPARKVAVLLVLLGGLIVFGTFGMLIVPPFGRQLKELIELSPQMVYRLQLWLQNRIIENSDLPDDFQLVESLYNQLNNFDLRLLVNRFFLVFSNTLSLTVNVLLVLVVMLMMLLNPQPYRRLFKVIFPSSMRRTVDQVLDHCEGAIAGWFIGITFNMVVIAVMSMIGLWLLGVPLVLANGLLAGLLAFIPNIGPVVSVIPPVAIALLEAPWKAIAVIGLYILIQQLESNLLTPFVMKQQVNLLPAITLLAQVVFSLFFGFLGLLLALPLALTLQQWLNEFWVKRYAEAH